MATSSSKAPTFPQADKLYLRGDGSWLSGPDLSSLSPILHERTCEMLWKSIVLPEEFKDLPHLVISGQRYEYTWEDSPDLVLLLDADRKSRRLEVRRLGPKTDLINLPDAGINFEISRATADEVPYLHIPVGGRSHSIKIQREAWNNFAPQLNREELAALQKGGSAFVLKS